MRRLRAILCLGVAVIVGGACSPLERNQLEGIEIGNPIIGKAIRVVPAGGNFVYLAVIAEPQQATLTQFAKALVPSAAELIGEASAAIETRSVAITGFGEGRFALNTTFANGETVALEARVTSDGTVSVVVTHLNGKFVASTFDLQASATCVDGTSNGAGQVANAACTAVVDCAPEFSCAACRSAFAANANVVGAFGASSIGTTWQAVIEAVASSRISADPTMLALCTTDLERLTCTVVTDTLLTDQTLSLGALGTSLPEGSACRALFKR